MYKYYFIFILPGTSIINIIFILLSDKYKFLNILYGHMIEFFLMYHILIVYASKLYYYKTLDSWEQISPIQIYLQCEILVTVTQSITDVPQTNNTSTSGMNEE